MTHSIVKSLSFSDTLLTWKVVEREIRATGWSHRWRPKRLVIFHALVRTLYTAILDIEPQDDRSILESGTIRKSSDM